ncbi:MAG: hypothetical protein AB7U35_05505, partial [Sphingobium sp.]
MRQGNALRKRDCADFSDIRKQAQLGVKNPATHALPPAGPGVDQWGTLATNPPDLFRAEAGLP